MRVIPDDDHIINVNSHDSDRGGSFVGEKRIIKFRLSEILR